MNIQQVMIMKTSMLLIVSFTVLIACTDSYPESYKAGDDELSLNRVHGSDIYIDQYQRLWALVTTNVEDTPYKAIPAGDNICLNENPRHFPGVKNVSDLSKYIFDGAVCRLKQTPYESFVFNVIDNASIVEPPCPLGYKLDGPCVKVEPDADQVRN